jgi:hypothetical protein
LPLRKPIGVRAPRRETYDLGERLVHRLLHRASAVDTRGCGKDGVVAAAPSLAASRRCSRQRSSRCRRTDGEGDVLAADVDLGRLPVIDNPLQDRIEVASEHSGRRR